MAPCPPPPVQPELSLEFAGIGDDASSRVSPDPVAEAVSLRNGGYRAFDRKDGLLSRHGLATFSDRAAIVPVPSLSAPFQAAAPATCPSRIAVGRNRGDSASPIEVTRVPRPWSSMTNCPPSGRLSETNTTVSAGISS